MKKIWVGFCDGQNIKKIFLEQVSAGRKSGIGNVIEVSYLDNTQGKWKQTTGKQKRHILSE